MTLSTALKLPLALALATALVACSGEPFTTALGYELATDASFPVDPISSGPEPDAAIEVPTDAPVEASDRDRSTIDVDDSGGPGGDNCCDDTCDDATIRACVCEIDEWCCSHWDSTCVAKLALGCGACP